MSIRSGIQSGIRSGIRSGVNAGSVAQRYFPTTLAAFTTRYPSLPAPLAIWPLQEGASPLDDGIGTKDFVANGAAVNLAYAQAGDPEPTPAPRGALQFGTAATTEWVGVSSDTAFGNIPVAGTRFLLVRFRAPDNAGTARSIAGKGSATVRWGLNLVATTGVLNAVCGDGTNTVNLPSVSAYDDGAYHDVAFGVDGGGSTLKVVTESENLSAALGAGLAATIAGAGLSPTNSMRLGAMLGLSPVASLQISYAALFDAVFSAAHMTAWRTPV